MFYIYYYTVEHYIAVDWLLGTDLHFDADKRDHVICTIIILLVLSETLAGKLFLLQLFAYTILEDHDPEL